MALAQGVKAELVGNLRRVHGVGQILLVREHQQHRVAELILRERTGQPFTRCCTQDGVEWQRNAQVDCRAILSPNMNT